MSKNAPILISVYDRKQHLQRCVDALKCNPEAKNSILYIVSDGWQCEAHRGAIRDVRSYIKSITGFDEVRTRFRETNLGMAASGTDAWKWVLEENDSAIKMEDDIVCSPHFLTFTNEALRTYENDLRVFAVCTHVHPKFRPPEGYNEETFLWQAFCPWGYGTWKNRIEGLVQHRARGFSEFADNETWRRFKRCYPIVRRRRDFLSGNIQNDAATLAHVFLTGQYSLFPEDSLSINTGGDGTGSNCALGWTYPEQRLYDGRPRVVPELRPSEAIARQQYWNHFSVINHVVVPLLIKLGCFEMLYSMFRHIVGATRRKEIESHHTGSSVQ
jgi:hypothetical protein